MEGAQKKSDSIFVKVDGYQVILQDLEVSKQVITNLREALAVLNKVSEVKAKSIETFMENIAKLNEKLNSINDQLPDVGEPSITPTSSQPAARSVIKSTINDLSGELDGLKNELSRIS